VYFKSGVFSECVITASLVGFFAPGCEGQYRVVVWPRLTRGGFGLQAWVNLLRGEIRRDVRHTCTAGAGTLLLEFATLSRLTVSARVATLSTNQTTPNRCYDLHYAPSKRTKEGRMCAQGEPVFEVKARAAVEALFERRSRLHLLVRTRCNITSSLGDAESSLGDAKRSLGDTKSSLGDAQSSLGDAESSLGDAKSSLGDAKSSPGDTKSSLGDVQGNTIDADTGAWINRQSSAGAGVDSYYEYLLKAYLLLGDFVSPCPSRYSRELAARLRAAASVNAIGKK
jgi:hypothetical protein